MIAVSIVFLAIGLIAPAISLVAYRDVALLGALVFKFESRGILQTILDLFQNGNWFLASLILLFSIVVPALKTVLVGVASKSVSKDGNNRIVKLLSVVGKWSMADVFVVAVLLASFAVDADKSTDAWLGHGLYFFAGYCVLSMISLHQVQAKVGGL